MAAGLCGSVPYGLSRWRKRCRRSCTEEALGWPLAGALSPGVVRCGTAQIAKAIAREVRGFAKPARLGQLSNAELYARKMAA